MTRMSNLANIHDHQALKMGYNAIISFSKAKNYVQQKKKENSTKDIYNILNNLILRRKTQYLSDLKYQTLGLYKSNVFKAFTVMHNMSNKLRQCFNKWKKHSNFNTLVKEMNEEGPVREEMFEKN